MISFSFASSQKKEGRERRVKVMGREKPFTFPVPYTSSSAPSSYRCSAKRTIYIMGSLGRERRASLPRPRNLRHTNKEVRGSVCLPRASVSLLSWDGLWRSTRLSLSFRLATRSTNFIRLFILSLFFIRLFIRFILYSSLFFIQLHNDVVWRGDDFED